MRSLCHTHSVVHLQNIKNIITVSKADANDCRHGWIFRKQKMIQQSPGTSPEANNSTANDTNSED